MTAQAARAVSGPRAALLDGKAQGAALRERVAGAVERLRAGGVQPGLAVVIVGEDPASRVYVGAKKRATVEAGMRSIDHALPVETSEAELLRMVEALNADPQVDGILVQLPLPPAIDAQTIIAAIDPDKDVDGFHPLNAGRLALGLPGLRPCTPLGCLMLIRSARPDLSGLDAVVLGRSPIVGRPVAQMLTAADCTVTVAHSRTKSLPGLCRRADILLAAVGRPEMVRGDWIKPGATVVDVGINRVPDPGDPGRTRLVGDVAFGEALEVAGALTPVPGGVGPMTIACLLRNTVEAACRRRGLSVPAL